MDKSSEINGLDKIAAGEGGDQNILYYCYTCQKVMSDKVAEEHKAKGHKVKIFLPPCGE